MPMLQSSPPLKLRVDPKAMPTAVHVTFFVSLHWHEAVRAGIERDVRRGVLERVPLNTPVKWKSRMHITAKQDGSSCWTID